MTLLKGAWSIIKPHRKAFLVLCGTFYGVLAFGMAVAMFVPALKPLAGAYYDVMHMDNAVMQRGLAAYANGEPFIAMAVTLLVNLGVATLLTTLPSLIVPFIGILAIYYRVLLWGPMFAPFGMERVTFIPHFPVVLFEGMAYIVAAFAAYVHGMMVLRPRQYGFSNRWEAYKGGLSSVAKLYVLVFLILLIGAIWEAYEVIYLVPHFVAAAFS